MSSLFELRLDRLITVEFAIYNNAKAFVFVGDGLVSGRQIDNAEPRVAKSDAADCCDPMTLTVRTTMAEALGGLLQGFLWYPTVFRKNCHDSAHLNGST